MALAIVLLTLGQLEEAWPLYECRPVRRPTLPFPEWDGSRVSKLLVWGEQGYGDQIMFSRFIPLLTKLSDKVIFMCRPGLERLFDQLPAQIIPMVGRTEFPDPDAWVMLNSLPLKLRISKHMIPRPPYLEARRRRIDATIGVMTHGNAAQSNDKNRSLPPDQAARLLALPGAIDLSPENTGARDFLETAEIMGGLDRIVSVDTAVANLSAAMGYQTDILLTDINTDWRWMGIDNANLWYPAARLHRSAGDWNSTLNSLLSGLA